MELATRRAAMFRTAVETSAVREAAGALVPAISIAVAPVTVILFDPTAGEASRESHDELDLLIREVQAKEPFADLRVELERFALALEFADDRPKRAHDALDVLPRDSFLHQRADDASADVVITAPAMTRTHSPPPRVEDRAGGRDAALV